MEDADKIPITIQGLAVMSAIPLVMYALWADYFGRHIEGLKEAKDQFDAEMESARIRLASASVILFQLLLFLGSGELRKENPFGVNGLLVAAVLIQGWMQSRLEARLGTDKTDAREQLKRGLIASTWILGSVLVYVSIVLATTLAFTSVATSLGGAKPVIFVMACIGAILGLIGGMALNFALGPTHLSKLLPSTPLSREFPGLAAEFGKTFAACRLQTPRLWIIESSSNRGATAFISGFRSGRGPFTPALFISRPALEKLTPEELQAVVRHEISHVLLNHLPKRFCFSASLVGGLTLLGIFSLLFTMWAFPKDAMAQQLTPVIALISFFVSYRWISHQSQKQEVEADYFAITRLHTEVAVLAKALHKLDEMNGIKPDQFGRTHPSTELRIAVLERVMANTRKLSTKASENRDKAA